MFERIKRDVVVVFQMSNSNSQVYVKYAIEPLQILLLEEQFERRKKTTLLAQTPRSPLVKQFGHIII